MPNPNRFLLLRLPAPRFLSLENCSVPLPPGNGHVRAGPVVLGWQKKQCSNFSCDSYVSGRTSE
jgi:hypothetical protein